MANPNSKDAQRAALRAYQHNGAGMYLAAYVGLMMEEMDVKATSVGEINSLVMQMVEPMNIATEAIWRALMGDEGWGLALYRFHENLLRLAKGTTS